jgi:hypothetical protein
VEFVPIRFVFRNKLNRDDKLLLAFDTRVLSEELRREVGLGKIVHGENYSTLKVKTSALASDRTAHRVRDCEIHFLGIWDTVKSYGGIWPKSLPHLRHNPIVKTIRHALALDEHRSRFIPTSWGG